ncbi:hypothetical protein BDZ97DRAFT_1086232 [Flammula alnicola]|nr:hypothetical protein BDZ97DRAFT_1086232 [Flammula alnicola]
MEVIEGVMEVTEVVAADSAVGSVVATVDLEAAAAAADSVVEETSIREVEDSGDVVVVVVSVSMVTEVSATVSRTAMGLLKQLRAGLVALLQAVCQVVGLAEVEDIVGTLNAKVQVGMMIVMRSGHATRSLAFVFLALSQRYTPFRLFLL